jgi:5-dehydro-2-deoxygluconokinase
LTYDLITVGRVNMDLYAQDVRAEFADITGFDAAVGGSPTNIAMGASRLGLSTAAFTAVGDDAVGDFVLRYLRDMGVDVKYVAVKSGRRTSLALLGLNPPERYPLTFYREDPADIHLTSDDAAGLPFDDMKAVLLSGDVFSRGTTPDAARRVAETAAHRGLTIYMDLDLRPSEWHTPHAFGLNLRPILPWIDVLIGTEEEFFTLLAPEPGPVAIGAKVTEVDRALLENLVGVLLDTGTVATVVMKRGAAGATVLTADGRIDVPGFVVEPVNTVGAGDAFAAGLITRRTAGDDWYQSARFANACGAIVVTCYGCSAVLPTLAEVTDMVERSEVGGRSGTVRPAPARQQTPRHPALTPGKVRGLSATSSEEGIFRVLAIDHRDSLRVFIAPDDPLSISDATLIETKLDLLRQLGREATAVMLDPEYSVAQAITTRSLVGRVGFLAAVEGQGYLVDPAARQTDLLEGWSVEKAKRVGASAIKMLVLYRPDGGAATTEQDEIISQVIADCGRHDIPLFLEPLPYTYGEEASVDSPEFAAMRRRVVIDTVRRLGALGPDILKVPFPVDTRFEEDRRVWAEACGELDAASPVPWVLLSGGDPYELFREQLLVASRAGASGFLVGRALWGEYVAAGPADKPRLMEEVVRPRFAELSAIAVAEGRDWAARFEIPAVAEGWYRSY